MIRHRLLAKSAAFTVLLLAAATSGTSAANAAPAPAAQNAATQMVQPNVARPANCPVHHSCYYDGHNLTGALVWVAPGPGFFDLGRMSPPKNDRISSIYNGGGAALQAFNFVSGNFVTIGPVLPVGASENFVNNGTLHMCDNCIDAIRINFQ
jgi:hypothetical protein